MSLSSERFMSDSARTSLLIGLGIGVKVVVDLTIAARFGLGGVTDAFFVAYTLPLLTEAILYPSAQLALVPIFVRELGAGRTEQAWRVFNSLFTALLLVSAVLVAIALTLGHWLVMALAPGTGERHGLTLSLFHLLVVGVLPVGPLAVMRAFLNSNRRFAAPAALELVRGGVVLAVLFFGYRSLGIEALAIGFVLASLVQFVLLGGAVVRSLGFGYRPMFDWSLLRSLEVGRLSAVPLADYCLLQSVLVLERVIGSYLPAGSITALSYGRRVVSAVGVGLFSGLEVVALPRFASEFEKGETGADRGRAALIRVVRLAFVIGTPIAVSAWALRISLTQLAFERGAFDHESTIAVAPVLGAYLLSLPLFGCWLLLRSYLFASMRALMALALSSANVLVNVGLALALWPFFGAQGVAVAYVGGLAAYAVGALFLVEGPLRVLQLGAARLAARVAVASTAMATAQVLVVSACSDLLGKLDGLSSSTVLASALAVSGVVGVPLLLAILACLGVTEAGDVWKRLRSPWVPR